jgi:hypothetical protein
MVSRKEAENRTAAFGRLQTLGYGRFAKAAV